MDAGHCRTESEHQVSNGSLMFSLFILCPFTRILELTVAPSNNNICVKETKIWLSFKIWCSRSVPRCAACHKETLAACIIASKVPVLLCQQANKQAQSQHKEQTAKLEVAPEPVWGVSAAVWAALLWFQPWLNEWNLATFMLKCCILIFPLPCSHKTKRSRLGTTQSIIPGKENLWETYIYRSQQGHANFSMLCNLMDACWVCNEAIEMLVCQLSMDLEKLKSDKMMS